MKNKGQAYREEGLDQDSRGFYNRSLSEDHPSAFDHKGMDLMPGDKRRQQNCAE